MGGDQAPTVYGVTPGQRVRIGQLLEEMEAEAGPIPPDLLDEARDLWRTLQPAGEHSADVAGADEQA